MEIPLLFGRFLVKQGRVKDEDLDNALKIQKEINPAIGFFSLENGFVTPENFAALLKCQREEALSFREAALKLQLLDEARLAEIEEKQKKAATNIGAILVRKGLLTEDDIEKELANFKGKNHL